MPIIETKNLTKVFDRFLVRPIDPLFHLLADRFCHDLDRDVALGLVWGGPAVAAVLLFLGYRAWRFGLRHYASTGS